MSNPHINNVETYLQAALGKHPNLVGFYGSAAQAEATLALAFEARTANLLTSQQIAHAALYKGGTLSAQANADLIQTAHDIETRLGLGDTK